MRYILAILVLLMFSPINSFAADATKPVLRWHGQSFFDLTTTKGTRIVFDPHAIDVYGRQSVPADLVLISHFHNDHTQVGVLSTPGKFKVLEGLKRAGNKMEWNLLDETSADVRVRTAGVFD